MKTHEAPDHGRVAEVGVGSEVAFVEESGDEGPQASTVRVLGKHITSRPEAPSRLKELAVPDRFSQRTPLPGGFTPGNAISAVAASLFLHALSERHLMRHAAIARASPREAHGRPRRAVENIDIATSSMRSLTFLKSRVRTPSEGAPTVRRRERSNSASSTARSRNRAVMGTGS